MKLFITDIEKILERETLNNRTREVINIFLAAINDWPNPVVSLEDYELEVAKFINGIPIKSRIEAALKKIDLSKDAWQSESLFQLVDIFQFYEENISLREIIENLKTTLMR